MSDVVSSLSTVILRLEGQQTLVDLDQPADLTLDLAPDADVRYCAVVGLQQLVKRIHFRLADRARLAVSTVVAGAGDDRLTVDYTLHHAGRGSRAQALVKGVFAGAASAEVLGLIQIDSSAQQTESFLEQRALLLSDAARANLQPQLRIEANEVKASHAATVGALDAEQLFYTQTRGLPASLAQRLIVHAFLAEALAAIPKPAARATLALAIAGKLGLAAVAAHP